MKKINKMNINGEIYDIQDNSSGYVKATEINDFVNQLVDEKVAEFLKAGFNIETVEELPTENISYKTIYLVPSENQQEENIYDEYIYTSENKWEKIGSTSIDLKNYATKEYVDESIKELEGNIVYLENKFTGQYSFTENDKLAIVNFMNKLLSSDEEKITIKFISTQNLDSVNSMFYAKFDFFKSDLIGKTTITVYDKDLSLMSTSSLVYFTLKISYKITDNVFSFGTGSTYFNRSTIALVSSSDVITKSNSVQFMPDQPFEPTTKCYVDEHDKYEWEVNNINLWAMYHNYEVGDIVYETLTHKLKYYKCITAHTSQNMIQNQIDNWHELTEEELEALKRPTKQYVDDAVANAGDSAVVITSDNYNTTEIYEAVTTEWQKCLNNEPYNIYISVDKMMAKAYFDLDTLKQFGFGKIQCPLIKTNMTTAGAYIHYEPNMMMQITDNVVTKLYNFNNGQRYVSQSGTLLSDSNTYPYTPTGNYNPATKKYVDDQVGAINTILATLTTVEEGE